MTYVVAAGDIRQRFVASLAACDGFAALMRRQLARAPTSVIAPPSHARKRASGQRVEFFIAEVAGNYGDRDGKVAGVRGETGNQRSRSFFAGCGGDYQGGDIFVVLNKVEDLLRFVAFTDHALRHHARDA